MQIFIELINATELKTATMAPEVVTTTYPGELCLGNSVEDSGSSNNNASDGVEESIVGQGMNRSFGA